MSQQTVISFLSKLDGDVNMQAQVRGLQGDVAGLITLAAKAGFQFTQEDWNGVVADLAAQASGALEDKDLEKVAGGTLDLRLGRQTYVESFLKPRLVMKL